MIDLTGRNGSLEFLILRGKVFNGGDRIVIGGVRGDVVDLSLLQTTVMEMGEAKGEQADSSSVWVRSRQYTGRLVTVSNAVIFDQPVYNYTREFPFIFEEIALPITYDADWQKAEQIILAAAEKHTVKFSELEKEAIEELKRRYFLGDENPGPRDSASRPAPTRWSGCRSCRWRFPRIPR